MTRLSGPATLMLTAVFGVGGAAHAQPVDWDAIARCESGGNWHFPNGGGLQIKPQTWWSNGGIGLPEWAPRTEQIRVAENVMASQGPAAWPTCASASGGQPRPGSIWDFLRDPGNPQNSCWLLLRCH